MVMYEAHKLLLGKPQKIITIIILGKQKIDGEKMGKLIISKLALIFPREMTSSFFIEDYESKNNKFNGGGLYERYGRSLGHKHFKFTIKNRNMNERAMKETQERFLN